MDSEKGVISRLWEDHRKAILAAGVLVWVLLIGVAYWKMNRGGNGERPPVQTSSLQTSAPTILPVGALPVT